MPKAIGSCLTLETKRVFYLSVDTLNGYLSKVLKGGFMFPRFIASFVIFYLINISVFASPNYPWKEIYKVKESAIGSAGFEILQNKYPNFFSNYDSKYVSSANVDTRLLEFTGAHTCPKNDPRLRHEVQGYGLCEVPNNDIGSCFQTAHPFPAPLDPCFKNAY